MIRGGDGSLTGSSPTRTLVVRARVIAGLALARLGSQLLLGRLADGFQSSIDELFGNCNFKLYLGQKIHYVFRTSVEFGMTLLSAKTFDFGNRHTLNTNSG